MGRAVSSEDEEKLLAAAGASRSLSLLALIVLSLDTGMRASEVQNLRNSDIKFAGTAAISPRAKLLWPKARRLPAPED